MLEKKHIIGFFLLFFVYGIFAQSSAQVEVIVSRDTILMGNYVKVSFIASNVSGQFKAPRFDGFDLISGPSTSSSYSFINGKESRKTTYTYVLKPLIEGVLPIDAASFVTDDEVLTSKKVEVFVKPNPEGLRENTEAVPSERETDFFEGLGSMKDFFNMDTHPFFRSFPEPSQPAPTPKKQPYKFKTEKL